MHKKVISNYKEFNSLDTYQVVPNDRLKKRLEFFYGPYNSFYNVHRGISFDEGEKDRNWCLIKNTILQNDTRILGFITDAISQVRDKQNEEQKRKE